MITRWEVLKGRACPPELEANLEDLLIKVNFLRSLWGKPMRITSGYRTPEHNTKVGGAKNSAHLHCQAVDIADPMGELGEWLLQNQEILEECGLWLEAPHRTPGWVHVQSRKAKNRVFDP